MSKTPNPGRRCVGLKPGITLSLARCQLALHLTMVQPVQFSRKCLTEEWKGRGSIPGEIILNHVLALVGPGFSPVLPMTHCIFLLISIPTVVRIPRQAVAHPPPPLRYFDLGVSLNCHNIPLGKGRLSALVPGSRIKSDPVRRGLAQWAT